MLPSTAPSGADPDSHHHSYLQLLIQWHLHHRGPYRPDQDHHLWVFKGRGSIACSAQICCCYRQPLSTTITFCGSNETNIGYTVSRSGRTRSGAPSWAWGCTAPSLAKFRVTNPKLLSKPALFGLLLRQQLMRQMGPRMAQLCPAPGPLPQKLPVAPQSPPLPLTSPRSAVQSCSVSYFCGVSPISPIYIYFLLHQVVKGGSSETRVEKRIVITADSEADQDQVHLNDFI